VATTAFPTGKLFYARVIDTPQTTLTTSKVLSLFSRPTLLPHSKPAKNRIILERASTRQDKMTVENNVMPVQKPKKNAGQEKPLQEEFHGPAAIHPHGGTLSNSVFSRVTDLTAGFSQPIPPLISRSRPHSFTCIMQNWRAKARYCVAIFS